MYTSEFTPSPAGNGTLVGHKVFHSLLNDDNAFVKIYRIKSMGLLVVLLIKSVT
jgi:hypothetical protein